MILINKLKQLVSDLKHSKSDNKEIRLLVGALLAKNVAMCNTLKEAEFKVFSQFGDDGIIQFLLSKLPNIVDKFVEFGVENYEESNTRFLLMNNNWQGLVIDGSENNITYIKNDPMFWRHDLNAVYSFITSENINQLLENNGFAGRIGILSIDIDGNDYWVWKSITVTEADIVIIEYNSLFGNERPVSVPYNSNFVRQIAHYSNLYFGASLPALYRLGKEKGYSFVGCNQAGNNAYFVKDHLMDNLTALSLQEGYVNAKFREGRNPNGDLSLAGERERKALIVGLPIINTQTGILEIV